MLVNHDSKPIILIGSGGYRVLRIFVKRFLHDDVFSHVQTMNTCHLAAIAARLGRVIKWNPKTEQIVGDEQAAAFFARSQRKGFEIPHV
jgi:hypothetical protein